MAIRTFCRNATTFAADGSLDEDAFRQSLDRFIATNTAVYLASGGSGEGHALSWRELKRVYEIGVETCRGRVPVYANPPEQNTAQATIEHSLLAFDAGVEEVNVYGPASSHGYKPTDAELLRYFDHVLTAVRQPVALAPHPMMGYLPKASLIADVASRHQNVRAINLSGLGESYFFSLQSALRRDVDLNVQFAGCIPLLDSGAAGVLGAEQNLIPKTFERFIQNYSSGSKSETARVYSQIIRFSDYMNRWSPGMIRPIKAAMREFSLPGWKGGLREPYLMLPDSEIAGFIGGLLDLDIPEIAELAASRSSIA